MRYTLLLAILCIGMLRAAAQKKIVVMGSSTALGAAATSGDSSWPGRLQQHFRKNTAFFDADTLVTVLGGYGYTTFKELPTGYTPAVVRATIDPSNNVTKALSFNPDIIIINLPSNDVSAYGWDPTYHIRETMVNFRVMYQHITAAGVKCYIATTQPRNDLIPLHRQWQRDLVDSIQASFGAFSINFWDDLVKNDGSHLLKDEVRHLGFSDQDYHLNDAGHRLLFERVKNKNIFQQVAPLPLSYIPVPAKIEAEAYTAQSGTQTEPTTDAGGGFNLGYIDPGDWMEYAINSLTGGNFIFRVRVASQMEGGQLQLKNSSGTVLASIHIPNTGGWQSWTTLEIPLTLPAGNQSLRIISASTAGWNINWLELAPAPSQIYTAIPVKIEAENYFNMNGVQNEPTTDEGGGQNLGYIDQADWMDYNISVPSAKNYLLKLRVASPHSDAQLKVYNQPGQLLAVVNIPFTGGWQNWTTVTTTLALQQGNQTIRLFSTGNNGWNINWLEFAEEPAAPPPPPPPSAVVKIEAEQYLNMSGIQTEPTTDTGGGMNVGYVDMGDWMDYAFQSNAGNFQLALRLAAVDGGGQLQVKKQDGTVLATLAVPQTGGWQNWQTATANINLPAGWHQVRLVSTAFTNWNLNWIELKPAPSNPAPPGFKNIPAKIEAENYSDQAGVQLEPCTDAGGGQNAGYIAYGDWMEYRILVPAAGLYPLRLRIASAENGGQIQVRELNGSLLKTFDIPNTGGWQNWETVSSPVSLPQGQLVIRLVSSAAAGWNLNWLEFAPAITPPLSSTKIEAENYAGMNGIQTEPTTDEGGGLNVGYIDLGDWMQYFYTAPQTGTYTIRFRLASTQSGGRLQLISSDGGLLATVIVPNTGGWQNWQTVSSTVTLNAGNQSFEIFSSALPNWNINWIEIVPQSAAASRAAGPGVVQQKQEQSGIPLGVRLFPNPVKDLATIELHHDNEEMVKAEIFDFSGRLVKVFSFNKKGNGIRTHRVSCNDLTSGIYIMRLTSGNRNWSLRFQKL